MFTGSLERPESSIRAGREAGHLGAMARAALGSVLALQTALVVVAGPSASTVLAAEPDPPARVMLKTHSIYVLDDSEWGTAELRYTVTVQRSSPSCGGLCPNDKAEYTYSFNGDKDMTKSFQGASDQLVPLYRSQSPPYYVAPQPGIAMFPGDDLIVKWRGIEDDPGIDDYLGSVETVHKYTERWGLDVVHEKWSNDILGTGGFKATYEIVRAPLPDLTVSNIRVGSFADNGDDIACLTVVNRGAEPSGPYTARFYVDGVTPANGVIAESGTLPAGGQLERCFQTTIAAGQHQFAATVDEDQKIPEMNEFNNRHGIMATIQRPAPAASSPTTENAKPEIGSAGKPDVLVSSIRVGANSAENDCDPGKNDVRVTIKNQGDADAGSFSVVLLVDGSEHDKGRKAVSSLAKGQQLDITFDDVRFSKGNHQLAVKLDGEGKLTESNEANNQLSQTVNCRAEQN